MKPKKIIFAHLLNDYSGSPKVLSQVIKAVQKEEFGVELYTGKSENGFLSELTDKHHHYFYKRLENKYLTFVTFMFSQISLFFKLLKHRNEDIVIYINTMLPFGAGLAGKIMGKPVYYHIHEISLTPASFKCFLRFIVQKTASKVIFVSKSVEEVESFISIPQQVIYNALPNEFVKIAIKSPYQHLRYENFNVLMICSLKAYKGIEEFVYLADRCERQTNIIFTLVLNAEQSAIDEYYKGRVLPSNMTLVPRQNNLIPYYQQASLVLNLSRIDEWVETFGLTIAEAMAFGVPVIVPPIGGPIEIVHDGQEGYLISSYETEKIAKIIMELSKDEKRCIDLSKAARKRAENFNEVDFEKNILKEICN